LDEAREKFNKHKDYGEKHRFDKVKVHYFAVSLPDLLIGEDDLNKRKSLHCWYLMGLGYLGLGNKDMARKLFTNLSQRI
jgi:hypothetical protein